jgi:hypothetical protein
MAPSTVERQMNTETETLTFPWDSAPHLQTWNGWDARRRAVYPKALHLHWCSYTDRTYQTLLAGWTASSQSGWVKGEAA